jgi:hypothetical protein
MESTITGVSKQSDTLPRKAPDTAIVILQQKSDTFCQKITESMVDGTGYLLDDDRLSG